MHELYASQDFSSEFIRELQRCPRGNRSIGKYFLCLPRNSDFGLACLSTCVIAGRTGGIQAVSPRPYDLLSELRAQGILGAAFEKVMDFELGLIQKGLSPSLGFRDPRN